MVAEFSFKYGDDQEDYRGSVARDAYDVLTALQNDLTDWSTRTRAPRPRSSTSEPGRRATGSYAGARPRTRVESVKLIFRGDDGVGRLRRFSKRATRTRARG